MAKAGELNGYPGPAHVRQLTAQLGLTEGQHHDVQAISDRMSSAAKPLGVALIERERALDPLFAKATSRSTGSLPRRRPSASCKAVCGSFISPRL